MAQSLTVVNTAKKLDFGGTGRGVRRLKLSWVSASDGSVNLTFPCPGGMLIRVTTVPSGVSAPTANYDITILDPDTSADILEGTGADRSASATETVYPLESGAPVSTYMYPGDHSLVIANAGDTKAGDIYLDLIEPN